MRRLKREFLGAAIALFVMGCGATDDRIAVHPVSGKVLVNGAPAAGAKVVLYSVEQQDPKTPFPSGISLADGTFRLTSYAEGDGAPAGTYNATVVWLEPIPAGTNPEMHSPRDRLSGKYSTPERSNLEVVVAAGENQLETFDLK